MSQQQDLLSSDAPDNRPGGSSRPTPVDQQRSTSNTPLLTSRAPRSRSQLAMWLQRFELFLRVVVRLYVGVLVMLLPWHHLWDDNRLLNYYPWLTELTTNGAVRGLVSGLGLLNLWVAISDAIHYRES